MSTGISFISPEEIVPSYEKQGYFAVKKFIPDALIDQAQECIGKLFRPYLRDQEDLNAVCIRLNKEDPKLLYSIYQTFSRTLELDEVRIRCKTLIQKIFPEKVYVELGAGLLMGLPYDERISYDWHQEIHYHSELEDVVHFWIPIINSANLKNGTMSILSGSSNLGKLPYKVKPKIVPNSVTNLVIQDTDILKLKNPEVFAIAETGDVVGLHSYVVHRSNTNTSNGVRFILSLRLAAVDRAPSSFNFTVKE